MIVVGIILSFAIAIFWIFLILCLSQSYYILYDNEDMPLGDIFRLSMDMMDGHKLDYILLFPYMNVAMVNFYDKIKKDVKIEN